MSNATGKEVHVESNGNMKTCDLEDSNRVLTVGHGLQLSRKVFDQDGVTDMVIEGGGEDGHGHVLQVETRISSINLIQVDRQEHWLQDDFSRLTILTSKPSELVLSSKGTLQFPVHPPLRVRFIVESIDRFHSGAENRPNYFGKIMTQDFFFPLEAYLVDE